MKTILFSLVTALAVSANAQIAMWKLHTTQTISGDGSVAPYKTTGYLLLRPGTNAEVAVVKVQRGGFSVHTNLSATIKTISTGIGQTLLAITIQSDIGTGSFTIRGAAVPVELAGASYYVPATLTFGGFEQYDDGSGTPYLEQWTGTASYDSADSRTLSYAGASLVQAIEAVEETLTADGLTQNDLSL